MVVKEWKSATLPAATVWFSELGTKAAHEELDFRLIDQMWTFQGKFPSLVSPDTCIYLEKKSIKKWNNKIKLLLIHEN